MPRASGTTAGPMWSAKHQAPTVRRVRRGSARRTRISPTIASRLSVSSTSGGSALSRSLTGSTSRSLTGPLIGSCLLASAAGQVEERLPLGRSELAAAACHDLVVGVEGDEERDRKSTRLN